MLSKVKSIALSGLDGNLVEIQTDISNGIPEFDIVGLPDVSVKESKKRINIAIKNSNIQLPSKKILINLAPANIRKEGSSFDLAMAVRYFNCNGKNSSNRYRQIIKHYFYRRTFIRWKNK